MSDTFKREERYIVVKRKHLVGDQEERIRELVHDELGIQTTECVVVESDWPEYEAVWRMIEERVTGSRPTPVGVSELADELIERSERGMESVLELQRMMDGHYKVIRQFLDAEQGPGFAHRVNSVLLRLSGHFFQFREKLSALRSMPEEGGEG